MINTKILSLQWRLKRYTIPFNERAENKSTTKLLKPHSNGHVHLNEPQILV
jgi:hypothetical protein